MIALLTVLGWAMLLIVIGALFIDRERWKRIAGQKESAKEIWREQAVARGDKIAMLRGEATNKDNAILALRVEIDSLTPKRNARGKFVGRSEEL